MMFAANAFVICSCPPSFAVRSVRHPYTRIARFQLGLDLIVESCAKPGHEAEWRRTIERTFAADQLSDAERVRFAEITIPPYAQVGAPRVGQDAAADAWIIEVRQAGTPEEIAQVLKDFAGYYALQLVESDGLPKYSHAGLTNEVDETSFRGAFFKMCSDVLDKRTTDQAWEHKFPDEAVTYGRALLEAADAAAAAGPPPKAPPKRGLLSALGLGRKAQDDLPFDEQLDVVRTAGRWYVFWGERGHPISAWF